jgi:hypothetical protein
VEVTNVETGESMVVKVSGPGRFVPQEDGSLIITGGGHWLLFATATDPGGPGMWYTTGPVGVSIGPDGLPASFDIGRDAVDLCEALAG